MQRFEDFVQLNESPDFFADRLLSFTDKSAIPFLVIFDSVIYMDHINSATHQDLIDQTTKILRTSKGNHHTDLKRLEQAGIHIINHDPLVYEFHTFSAIINEYWASRMLGNRINNVCSGRFWAKDRGYISFWERRSVVKRNIKAVERFIHKLGYDIMTVTFDAYIRGKDTVLTYREFMTGKAVETSLDDAERRRLAALHLQAGMKRETGDSVGHLPLHPSMTDAEYHHRTTFGDSVDRRELKLTESTLESREWQVDKLTDLL
mgnify:CR=1 FL=1|jgi:hypothetical protein